MLQFENVSTFYGKIQALHSVNVEVRQGEIVTLIGANGAGKSTLLMTLCGSPQAHSGSIRYMGEELVGQDSARIMRKSIAVVPEGRRVFARLTVEENLAMGGFFTDKGDYQEQMDKVLHLFPRLKERFTQRGGTMSGGEQQMLAIGRALMSKPKLLLLDEPSLGLAPIIIQQIFDIIEQLRKDGVTVFLVEQNANQALKIADRAYVLENGRVVMQGTGEALLTDPKVREAYLGVESVAVKKRPSGRFFVGARLARDEGDAIVQKSRRLFREQALLPHNLLSPHWVSGVNKKNGSPL